MILYFKNSCNSRQNMNSSKKIRRCQQTIKNNIFYNTFTYYIYLNSIITFLRVPDLCKTLLLICKEINKKITTEPGIKQTIKESINYDYGDFDKLFIPRMKHKLQNKDIIYIIRYFYDLEPEEDNLFTLYESCLHSELFTTETCSDYDFINKLSKYGDLCFLYNYFFDTFLKRLLQ